MKSFEYTIKDELGIHARPAGMRGKGGKKFCIGMHHQQKMEKRKN